MDREDWIFLSIMVLIVLAFIAFWGVIAWAIIRIVLWLTGV